MLEKDADLEFKKLITGHACSTYKRQIMWDVLRPYEAKMPSAPPPAAAVNSDEAYIKCLEKTIKHLHSAFGELMGVANV